MAKKSKRNQENILFILMGFIILGLVIAGFFLFQKQFMDTISQSDVVAQNGKPGMTASQTPVVTPQDSPASSSVKTKAPEEFIPESDAQTIKVYYGIKGKDKMEAEERKIRKSNAMVSQVRAAINTVLTDPLNERLYKLVPEGTTLRGLFYDSGVYLVDFSREFNEIYTFGAAEQALAIYSIVNSISEIDSKAKIKFLINGTEPDGEEGHIDLASTLCKFNGLIEN